MQINPNRFYFLLIFLLPLFVFGQQPILTEMNDFYPDELIVKGFTLTTPQEITVTASAITPYRGRNNFPFTQAWIIDSKTRDLVWTIIDADEIDRSRRITTFEEKVQLEPGNYEVYYSTFANYQFFDGNWYGRNGFWDNLFGNVFYGENWGVSRRDYRDVFLVVKGDGNQVDAGEVEVWQESKKEGALLDFGALRDEVFKRKIMKVNEPVKLKLYAIGEAREDGKYDFGWIKNIKTREKVWELTYRESDPAGGARKNRFTETEIELNPGLYEVAFVTDDSHSYRRWNSASPYDPAFWGLTIWLVDGNTRNSIVFKDIEKYEDKNVIVEIDRVGDSDYRSKGFSLKRELSLNIYALGEGRDGEMYDYGWIVDANTREKIWEMEYYDTENAGGAEKNRLVDTQFLLAAGNYIAYYVTDGSHSYSEWNSGQPYDPKRWGITISVLDDNFTEGDVTDYDESDDESVLVRITRIGDDDRARSGFSIEKDQKVHIYAIGEGRGNEMFDYAWVENAQTGRIVWEMTYRKTERAGGASKNRLFDGNIFLEAGEYNVFYKSDDSHSFADWNESPPHDPINWGITITKLEK